MKKNWKYSLLLIATVFALTMGIFFLFYRFDNKYTARGIRPFRESSMYLMMILCIILPGNGNIIRICC